MEMNNNDLLIFLVKAKKETYASGTGQFSTSALLEGSHQLEYEQGDYLYRDIYYGSHFFVGQEIVYFKGKPIWSMSYAGGTTIELDQETLEFFPKFHKKAMRQISERNPFRGPNEFYEEEYTYTDKHEGDIERFTGIEKILQSDLEIYQLNYTGGLIHR
ncbi:DUF5680 domain-containing protein [Chengkuizengella axinellae]|uniref:DUF5680 domain-containing protein n=1 Tax=Chengkuizengella axinellae TaxID=3064388 RepID=A0ABT9J2R3_9BACL|nr:DUF5680 domain-containing protein [Chengkuizengella sp. 2205SS18-9]MDP5275732.1 DUF5680 domain-containing protein [Chengkuizengella sp. 2205SS18-9]